MQKRYIYFKDITATLQFATQLAESLNPAEPQIIFLEGDLGAGKTTLVQMILQALGWPGRVKSPTYSLIEPYKIKDLKIYHLDLYRIQDQQELYFMGLQDLFQEQALFLIEWPERLNGMGIQPDITLSLSIDKENEQARFLTIQRKI